MPATPPQDTRHEWPWAYVASAGLASDTSDTVGSEFGERFAGGVVEAVRYGSNLG
jgi:hypothetical protein